MRRPLRTLSLITFLAGVILVLVGASGARFHLDAEDVERERRLAPGSRGMVRLGLALQGVGVVSYLAIAAFWQRRRDGR